VWGAKTRCAPEKLAIYRQDANFGTRQVLNAFEPQVTQAVAEFPAVLAELQARLPLTDGPIGLVGASIGTLPAQLEIAEGAAQVAAAALISRVIQLAEVVAANERP
jgi:hypothetical protein